MILSKIEGVPIKNKMVSFTYTLSFKRICCNGSMTVLQTVGLSSNLSVRSKNILTYQNEYDIIWSLNEIKNVPIKI